MSGYYSTTGGRHIFRLLDGERTDGYSGPYVVIDPEDREAVERLILALPDAAEWGFASADNYDNPDDLTVVEGIVEPFQAALRDIANPKPPKPDEPQGLGAVVMEASGRVLVRTSQDRKRPWCVAGTSNHVGWCEMDDEPLTVIHDGHSEVSA